MEIRRVGGGIEYRQDITSLVLPGDKDYRVRTVRTSGTSIVQPPRNTGLLLDDRSTYSGVKMTRAGLATANENALALLRHLGDLETAGNSQDYTGLNVRDEFAGGHRGIIDIRV